MELLVKKQILGRRVGPFKGPWHRARKSPRGKGFLTAQISFSRHKLFAKKTT
ncbi:unnamed protein product [Dovyalis caffra]|uniref:Uncharacterized protein n=1 Tax=Dovyalis caffra TaxID=77055 RepID=A0AAV1QNJ3_9ROSI|nr:unnamed protein product [Dovyalis caffra]